ncbi:MAG: type I restriction endonuclease subunit R [Saprospiraceae bacterium]
MAHFIYEHQIESRCVEIFRDELGYDALLNLWQLPDDGNAAFGRTDAREVVHRGWLRQSLQKINYGLAPELLAQAERALLRDRSRLSPLAANREVHALLTEGLEVLAATSRGVNEPFRVRFVDFEHPERNHFALVQQLTIRGRQQTRRPDLLVYVNGLPLVFIELKNLTEPVRQAFDKNVRDYKRDIPQLFHFNLLLLLSNVEETKVGSMTSDWEHFFNWEKVESEDERPVPKGNEDLSRALLGICRRETLLDLLRHFTLFYLDKAKIVAKNHQFLGVNNAIEAYRTQRYGPGKLGVFWHTQGSGKSFSMVFFVKKLMQRFVGNQKFVIVLDREELERQIKDEFTGSGLLHPEAKTRATDREDLQRRLRGGDRFVFTLIQKFSTPKKGEVYPLVSDRSDIIVIVDEAHRSQYADLAENMRRALPRAQYIAFTGTPLLDAGETTKQWFGDYVSRYDFADSVADGNTVRIFHQNRVPQMQLTNDLLNEEVSEIFEDENLSDEQRERLLKEKASIETIIEDEDRLWEIARDIAKHFPERGYLGKGMVISITKEVCVKMYDLVQKAWGERKRELRKMRTGLPDDSQLRADLTRTLDFMDKTEMAVVISYTGEDEEKFQKRGLNLRPHIERMNRLDEGYGGIEDQFKAKNNPLRLVFVCSKWLTGFDAPTVSTLYLDKPMQNHTLMQTIARANRVAPALNRAGFPAEETDENRVEKQSGIVIDYIGVFKSLEKALAKYARKRKTPEGEEGETEYPAETFEESLEYLDLAIEEGLKFLDGQGLDFRPVLAGGDVFEGIEQFKSFADALSRTDELKKTFGVHQTAITAFYEACKPDIVDETALKTGNFRGQYRRTRDAFEYLRKIILRKLDDTGDYDAAKNRAENLIDESVISLGYEIRPTAELDLSSLDFERLAEKFKATPYPHLAISDMTAFLQERLGRLLNANVTRVDLAERLQNIIRDYNELSSDVNEFFRALKKYAEQLRDEEKRAAAEGLSEAELELFDLLFQEKLTQEEKQKVKLAAKTLLQKLQADETSRKIMVTDWHRNVQTRGRVREMIGQVLDEELPSESYGEAVFTEKLEAVYAHIEKKAVVGERYWL